MASAHIPTLTHLYVPTRPPSLACVLHAALLIHTNAVRRQQRSTAHLPGSRHERGEGRGKGREEQYSTSWPTC